MRAVSCFAGVLVGCAPPAVCPSGTAADDAGICRRPPVDAAPTTDRSCEPRNPPEQPGPELCTSTYPGDLVLRTDEDVAAICPTWDCVAGGVQIGGLEGPDANSDAIDITDLSPLSCLRWARFFMVSATTELEAVELPGLVATGGGFSIALNRGLTSLVMPSLRYIAGDLSVQANEGLEHLELPALGLVGEFFLVVDNPDLPTASVLDLRDGLCPDGVGAATSIFGNGA